MYNIHTLLLRNNPTLEEKLLGSIAISLQTLGVESTEIYDEEGALYIVPIKNILCLKYPPKWDDGEVYELHLTNGSIILTSTNSSYI